MNQLVTLLLSFVLHYGYAAIMLVVFGGELGIPLPVSTVLLAGGSFTVDGTLNIFLLIPLVACTAILGDVMGYWFGRKFGNYIVSTYLHNVGLTKKRMAMVERFLANWGIWCVFLSRWLVTPLGIPVNVVAGTAKFPFGKFLFWIVIGECIWATLYIYLGYLFGSNWLTLVTYLTNAPWIFVLLGIGVGSLLLALRLRKKHG